MNHPQQQDKQGGQQHRCKVPKCPYRHDHPQQEAQSITVKPDTASVSANRASAGNRSNQKLTEVSSELDPQQQESWVDRFHKKFCYEDENGDMRFVTDWEYYSGKLLEDEVKAFISTERQRVLDEVRGLVEGMKKQRPLKNGNEPYPSFTMGKVDGHNQAIDDLLSALKEMEDK